MNPILRDTLLDQGLISRAGCIMKSLWMQIPGDSRLWPLHGRIPALNQWQEDSRETKAQVDPPANLEAPSLGELLEEKLT